MRSASQPGLHVRDLRTTARLAGKNSETGRALPYRIWMRWPQSRAALSSAWSVLRKASMSASVSRKAAATRSAGRSVWRGEAAGLGEVGEARLELLEAVAAEVVEAGLVVGAHLRTLRCRGLAATRQAAGGARRRSSMRR